MSASVRGRLICLGCSLHNLVFMNHFFLRCLRLRSVTQAYYSFPSESKPRKVLYLGHGAVMSLRGMSLTILRLRSQAFQQKFLLHPLTAKQRRLHTKARDRSVAAAVPDEPAAVFEGDKPWSALDDVFQRRAKAGKLIAGVAAASDSDMFKAPVRKSHRLSFSSIQYECSLTRDGSNSLLVRQKPSDGTV
jgi:hypothetical protein